MSRSYYDDNFGHYRIEDEGDVDFYNNVQQRSVEKRCDGCGARVKLLPDYAYCNNCADKIERGMELPGYDDDDEDGAEEAREAAQSRLRADIGDDELPHYDGCDGDDEP